MRLKICNVIVGLALALVASSEARAGSGAVLVVGKALPKERAVVAAAVRSAAHSGGWDLVETPLADAEVNQIVNCLKETKLWACVSPVLAGKGIERLIVVRVEPDGNLALALTEQILVPDSNVTTTDQRPCPKCVDESLTRVAFDLTKKLLEESATGAARTTISVKSTPHGAWITLDSTNVGLTDRQYATFPGRHMVMLQREGYETETRTVEVIENQDTVVAVDLRAKDSGQPVPSDHPHVVSSIVIGAGAVAAIGGLVLQLTNDPPASGPQPKYIPSTSGIGLMIGGSVAIGVGTYLWIRASHASQSKPSSMPTASITQGGGIVGWTGRF